MPTPGDDDPDIENLQIKKKNTITLDSNKFNKHRKRKRTCDENDETITHPTTKIKAAANNRSNKTYPLTQNSFENLQNEEDENDNSMTCEGSSTQIHKPNNTTTQLNKNALKKNTKNVDRVIKPPPIIIHNTVDDHKYLIEQLKLMAPKGFSIKYNKETITIFINDLQDWKDTKEVLEASQVEYHSYTSKNEKTHAFVIKGLDNKPSMEEIQEELENSYKLSIKNVFEMKGTVRPAYLIVTDDTVTLKNLQQKVQILNNIKIQWSRHYNNKLITQCHRCQMWGHATSNCRAQPVCMKCANEHFTKDCQKPDCDPPKCINCEGEHPANSTQCRGTGVYPGTTSKMDNESRIKNLSQHVQMEIEKDNTKKRQTSPNEEEFQKPKKVCFLSKYAKQAPTIKNISFITTNRYENLRTEENEQEEEEQAGVSNYENEKIAKETNEKTKIPPIVINKKFENHNELTKEIKKTLTKGFYLKFTKNTTLIFAEDENEYKTLLKELEDTELEHHYYTLPKDKSHAFVLRGLDTDPELTVIEDALHNEHQITTRKIFRMKTKSRPLYLITTNAGITLNWLNQNVKYLLQTRVYWDRRQTNKEIIQCHRCQSWGHATSNCRRDYKCLKCAKDHPTYMCKKTIDMPAVCANCGEDHPANSTKCKVYLDKIERKSQNRPNKQIQIKRNNPFTLRTEEFPELSLPSTSAAYQKEPNRIPPVTRRAPWANRTTDIPVKHPTMDFSDISEVTNELNKLNEQINMKQVLEALKDLNQRISRAKNNFDVILIMQAFKDEVNEYTFFKNGK
ncbi:unnamed protein product [Phyllotreta striolata]|uniref:Nucleic-acid-binding protein from transposon X-element n=1 Tax=Phyllotreta striolata TaxID=444603 RepID=A0A9N9TQ00_PHYSR|nr:unnamed protein product [Phyllotreta striolata]